MVKNINKKNKVAFNHYDRLLLELVLFSLGVLIGTYVNFGPYLLCFWFIVLGGLLMLFNALLKAMI